MRITLTQEIASSSAAKAPQSPLTIGQGEVIRATVVSVEGENVSLKTEDGRVFSARLQPGTVLMEHDTVELMAGGERQQPVLRVVFVEPGRSGISAREAAAATTQAALTQQLKEAFGQMNLKPTPKLVSLAAEILRNYPIDAGTAAFFAANNIPATNESIRAFRSILNGKQFGTAFYEVAQGTASALGQAAAVAAAEHIQTPLLQSQPDSSAQPNPAGRPAAAQEGQSGILQAVQIVTSAALQGQQAQAIPQQGDTALIQAEGQAQILTGQQQIEAGQPQGQTPAQPQAEGAPVTGQEKPVLSVAEEPTAGKEQIQPQAQGTLRPQEAPAMEKPALALQGESVSGAGKEQPQAPGKETVAPAPEQPVLEGKAAAGTAAEQIQPQKAAAGRPDTQKSQEGVLTMTDAAQPGPEQAGVGDTVAHNTETAPNPDFALEESSNFQNAAKSEEKAVLKQLLELFAKAGEDLDAQTLKKSVEETPQKLLELQKLIKNTDIHTQETLASRFQELTAQAKLAEDISRFVFVQIPIHLKEYGSAELYIYKRNRREKGAERQSTSVVLGLSTQNLGRVEAMLRMENRDLSLDIRVQNEKTLAAFRENSGELQRSFSELRFQLKEYKVSPLREKTTPLNAEEKLVRMHAPSGAGVDVMI